MRRNRPRQGYCTPQFVLGACTRFFRTRKAVETLLHDAEWGKWSNVEIAERCAVDESTVRLHRDSRSEERTYTTKHGTPAVMNTARIGKREAGTFLHPFEYGSW